MRETDLVHDIAVAVALGLAAELELMDAEFTRAGGDASSSDFLPLLDLLGSRAAEAERRHALVEQWVRGFDEQRAARADAPFALRSAESEQMALGWIELECLMILQGNTHGLRRLLQAVHSANLLFERARWMPSVWRAQSSTAPAMGAPRDPTLAEVQGLLAAVQAARASDAPQP